MNRAVQRRKPLDLTVNPCPTKVIFRDQKNDDDGFPPLG